MPARVKPPRPNNIAFTVYIDTVEHIALKNSDVVIMIDSESGDQTEMTSDDLENKMVASRESLIQRRNAQVTPTQREKSQEIIARQERENKKAR
jgi:hypothetical protein